jgi:glutathione S-transferase
MEHGTTKIDGRSRLVYSLYYSPGACSLAPHVALEEIGEPYGLELVSVAHGGTQTPEYRAINPKGRVPALRRVPGRGGGPEGVLTEAPAILAYLARTHPEGGLWPSAAADEARCLEWLNFLSTNVHAVAYGQVWRPERFVDDGGSEPAVVAKGRQNVLDQYAYVEGLLGDGRDWAVPGAYGVVDPFLLVFYRWGNRIGLGMRSLCPAWTRHAERLVERPAVKRALEQEGIGVW